LNGKAVSSIEEPLWSATRLSDVLALDVRLVRRALETQPSREVNGKRGWLLRDAAPAVYRYAWKLDRVEPNPERMAPKDRLDHFRAEREKSSWSRRRANCCRRRMWSAQWVRC
jgi:hypothetical protein